MELLPHIITALIAAFGAFMAARRWPVERTVSLTAAASTLIDQLQEEVRRVRIECAEERATIRTEFEAIKERASLSEKKVVVLERENERLCVLVGTLQDELSKWRRYYGDASI